MKNLLKTALEQQMSLQFLVGPREGFPSLQEKLMHGIIA